MGTIVAVKKNSEIAIASDCCNVRDDAMRTSMNISHGCILRIGDSFLGLHSSLGFQQTLEELLPSLVDSPGAKLTSRTEIRTFFSRVHDLLKQRFGLYVNFQQGQEFEWTPMNALVVNASGIYKIDSTRAVYEFTKFWALGSGEPFALGAMAAIYENDFSAAQIARSALSATQQVEGHTEKEFEVLTLESRRLFAAPMPVVAGAKSEAKRIQGIPRTRRPRNRSK